MTRAKTNVDHHLDNPWGLTQREFQFLTLRCVYTVQTCADKMRVSYGTANDYMKAVHTKLGVNKIQQLVITFDRWRCMYLKDETEGLPAGDPRITQLREELGFELEKQK